jgi:hypothetical protein
MGIRLFAETLHGPQRNGKGRNAPIFRDELRRVRDKQESVMDDYHRAMEAVKAEMEKQ